MGPVELHGMIVMGGFLPMYIAAGFGVEFPMIGFPELDTSYATTPWVKCMMLMTAALMVGSALAEIRGEMSLKTFMQYHWFLSAILLVWQFGTTATSMGKMMFVVPHLFTVWSTFLSLGGKNKKA
mgnify:CR=1 FL=1